jgi:acyl carrier protein
MAEPLRWCLDWDHLSRKEKFLMGAPFLATEDRAYRDIVRQLETRTVSQIEEWARFPGDVQDLARRISRALKNDGVWPSELFLPDDPADIPFALHFDFTDKWDSIHYSIDLVEKRFGIEIPIDFWERLDTMSFAEAVTEILRHKAEQCDEGERG